MLLGHRHLAVLPTLAELVEVRHEHVTRTTSRVRVANNWSRAARAALSSKRSRAARARPPIAPARETTGRRRPRARVARPPRPRTRGRGSRASPGRARRRPRRRVESLPACDSARAAYLRPRRGGLDWHPYPPRELADAGDLVHHDAWTVAARRRGSGRGRAGGPEGECTRQSLLAGSRRSGTRMVGGEDRGPRRASDDGHQFAPRPRTSARARARIARRTCREARRAPR